MKCKECYFVTPDYTPDCENGPCPLEITETERQLMMSSILLQMPDWQQHRIVAGYRKLLQIQYAFDDQDEDMQALIAFIEDAFPGHDRSHIKDDKGDINTRYYELIEMALNKTVHKFDFFEAIMDRPYSKEDEE